MDYRVHVLLNFSILFTGIALLIRFKRIPGFLYPFCCLIVLALINELLSFYFISNGSNNTVNGNIYVLIEFGLLCYQFCVWGVISRRLFAVILVCGLLCWVIDNFLLSSIGINNSLSRIVFGFLYVFLSIDVINRRIVFGREKVYANSILLISVGMLLFFGCKSFVEVFNVFDLGLSNGFYARVWFSLSVINAVSNLLYAIALLCLSTKRGYILLS